MLNRKYRAIRSDIENAIKAGQTISEDLLYAKVSRTAPKLGFAVVVSKKTEKTSVGRHLIKRRIHGAIEADKAKIHPHFTKTIVFFAKKVDLKEFSYAKIKEEVEKILEKSGCFIK